MSTLTSHEINQPIKVLDHGYVQLIDVMGDDRAIAQAAWISTDHEKPGEDRSDDAVRRVIRYMMRNGHTSPFEMVELKFRIQAPMDCWRQWIRHRTANVNEYSTRYSPAIELTQETDPEGWRGQGKSNHQGSEGQLDSSLGLALTGQERIVHRELRRVYQERLAAGVAREQARKDLPLSTYTNAYWKNDLHNLLHFLELRMDEHAQEEIRAYANVIGAIVAALFPLTWKAFRDFRLEAQRFSFQEMEVLRLLFRRHAEIPAVQEALANLNLSKGERRDFFKKMQTPDGESRE